MLDLVIKNSKIVDGTGNPWYISDVGIKNGKIKHIGIVKEEARTVIDGSGLYLSPGFVDHHCHTDLQIFHDSSVYNKLEQGITSDNSGLCGMTMAPVSNKTFDDLRKYLNTFNGGLNNPSNWNEFETFNDYIKAVENLDLGTNLSFYVGHGTIRVAVMGFEDRVPTKEEMDKMKSYVREAMESGAVGLSSGLIYSPGIYTKNDELIELCKIVKEYNGNYTTHIRAESYGVIEAIKEAIDVGRQSGVQVIIAHHKIACRENIGKSSETLRLIEEARDEGINIILDQYPFEAGATMLEITIPPRFREGGTDKLIERIKNTEIRKEIEKEIYDENIQWENMIKACGFSKILIASAANTKDAVGKTVEQYAIEKEIHEMDAIYNLLIENHGDVGALYFYVHEKDIVNIMQNKNTIIATDAAIQIKEKHSHPRYTSTTTKILKKYVKEEKVLSLEDAIRKMTSFPARVIGLKKKGLILEDYDADIVLFDLDKICNNATYMNTDLKNNGINYVIVGGEIAVENNVFNGCLNGKVQRIEKI